MFFWYLPAFAVIGNEVRTMKNMKLLRVLSELTQAKVQKETGIDQSVLSKYETGEYTPRTENLLILAKFYNTSLDYLMDLTDVKEPYPRKAEES